MHSAILFYYEFLGLIRHRVNLCLIVVVWLLLVAGLYSGHQQQVRYSFQKTQADSLLRKEFGAHSRNAHSAAHFGTYLFRSPGALETFDQGITVTTGYSYRVEAHRQGDLLYSQSPDTDMLSLIGQFSVANLLQTVLPLFVILLSFPIVAQEKEQNSLALILSQGTSLWTVLLIKFCCVFSFFLLLLSPLFFTLSIYSYIGRSNIGITTCSWAFSVMFYVFIWTGISVGISAWSRNPRQALMCLLGIWIVCCLIIPRAASGLVSTRLPLISREAFEAKVNTAFYNGMGNDGSYESRRKKLIGELLAKHRVDRLEVLPFNPDGLLMQAAEDYNSKAYHYYANALRDTLLQQKKLFQWWAMLSPALAQQQLSMALAGTDLIDQNRFHQQAGRYRDGFIRRLNLALSEGKSTYGNYQDQVSPDFLNSIETFTYHPRTLREKMGASVLPLASLVFWSLLAFGSMLTFCFKRRHHV